ncbi:MAG: tetratricopeptide repeat protein [Bacteroidetes bacterium]|nr:tetratricopeptide repeat protein [Bacteroidota bacterium]
MYRPFTTLLSICIPNYWRPRWLVVILCFPLLAKAQPNTSVEVPKPAKYENRTLSSERSGEKKFTYPRRVYNNTVSRFNYHFNARELMNDIEERAAAIQPDDYTHLLPFYPYQLSETVNDPLLDTVIYKCTAGILLHDLRSDWVDKLYLLMGRAYLLQQHFDSAGVVFQYINYAFAPKDDGYDVPIGSNASNTNGVFTIATRESKSLWKRITSFPPSRNESFLWQARNQIEQENFIEAATLLELLKKDPQFPVRLQPFLHEITAYVFYKQQAWEQAARELVQSLPQEYATASEDRTYFLAAQLFALAQQNEEAIKWFNQAIRITHDPLLEIYARLQVAGLAAGKETNAIQQNLDELLKMARKDKYESNRDIIYYAAAQLEIQQKHFDNAQQLLLKSVESGINNDKQRDQSYLLLADINYQQKKYVPAQAFYDSIRSIPPDPIDARRVAERKPALKIIANNILAIQREDSLQTLAGMQAEERNLAVKKVLRQVRKEKGLKDLPNADPIGISNPLGNQSLFAASGSGEFYFLNANLLVNRTLNRTNNLPDPQATLVTATVNQADDKEITLESLYKNIPLDDLKMGQSNGVILKSLLENALTFQNQLEDYPTAIEIYESIIKRFPESSEVEVSLFNLAYCYRKMGDPVRADAMAARLKAEYPAGKLTQQLNQAGKEKEKDPATIQYEKVYKLFIEGSFEEAKAEKIKADKELGNSYWKPQLLYIEAIYYIKTKQDSIAINRLENISRLFPQSTLAEKSATMVDVLKRRNQIEAYLSNLSIERGEEDLRRGADVDVSATIPSITKSLPSLKAPNEPITAKSLPVKPNNTELVKTGKEYTPTVPIAPVAPLIRTKPLTLLGGNATSQFKGNSYSINPNDTAYLVLMLDKVDPIFVSESKNAFTRFNQQLSLNRPIAMSIRKINNQLQYLLFGPFENFDQALQYMEKVRPSTATRILPWLGSNKYKFSMISPANLALLQESQDIEGYNSFLHELYPEKF